jgi:hypothetical protein
VVATPMMELFTRARAKWLPEPVSNAARKLSSVTCVGHGVVS